jgi:hypothetical protein
VFKRVEERSFSRKAVQSSLSTRLRSAFFIDWRLIAQSERKCAWGHGCSAYLPIPIDVVPDFIVDSRQCRRRDLVVVVLRSVVRRAGPEAIRRNGPGTSEGLATVWWLARLDTSAQGERTERSAFGWRSGRPRARLSAW